MKKILRSNLTSNRSEVVIIGMIRIGFICFVLWFSIFPVFSQTIDSIKTELNNKPILESVFEGPINADLYVVGPGDLLTLQVIGTLESSLTITISPEGFAQIPTVGQVSVADKSLSEVSKEIIRIATPKYPNAELKVRLAKVRLFQTSVSGAVKKPGRYVMSPVSRVSDLLEEADGPDWGLANNDTTPDGTLIRQPLDKAPLRGLILIHRTGDTTTVDLEKFYRLGDIKGNPNVMDGDRLIVPYWNEKSAFVQVIGAVNKPVMVRFLPSDQLRSALDLAGGFLPDARGDVELIRFDDLGQLKVQVFSKEWVNSKDEGPNLLPNDFIIIQFKKDLIRRGVVRVEGEVIYPGEYAVDESTTRISDVLTASGGFTSRANLAEVVVARRSLMAIPDPEFNRLYGLARTDMTWTENEYLKAKRRDTEPRVVVDIHKLLQSERGSKQDIVLLDGDVIRVPKKFLSVKVLGQVVKPGLVPFEDGENFKFYIERAGGFTFNARTSKIRIIKTTSGQWLKPGATKIEAGDTIFIPEKQEADWWASSKDILSVMSQIATIALVIYTVNK